ncbi:MAG: hypothetical protein ACM3NQ_12415 [Bacteroidales bacterium]
MTVRRRIIALLLFSLPIVAAAHAQVALGPKSVARFASRAEGADILGRNDGFVQRLSPFDLAARLKKAGNISTQSYLEFVRASVRDWTDDEKRKLTDGLGGLQEKLRAFALPLPAEVLFIKTSGQEEGGAAYTRANAIIVPATMLGAAMGSPEHLVAHELFHVLSRANPKLRDRLYAAIGFERCHEVVLPPSLASRRLTNPDAPTNDHCIKVTIDGKDTWVVPILFAKSAYDPGRGGDQFFDYMQFKLLVVERTGAEVRPAYAGNEPRMVDPDQVSGFFEQVGRNTSYIIHPEEILADNFAMLVLGQQAKAKSPEVLEKMRALLMKAEG